LPAISHVERAKLALLIVLAAMHGVIVRDAVDTQDHGLAVKRRVDALDVDAMRSSCTASTPLAISTSLRAARSGSKKGRRGDQLHQPNRTAFAVARARVAASYAICAQSPV
jgi:hypothetical protein